MIPSDCIEAPESGAVVSAPSDKHGEDVRIIEDYILLRGHRAEGHLVIQSQGSASAALVRLSTALEAAEADARQAEARIERAVEICLDAANANRMITRKEILRALGRA